jgi:hypothetical protein
MPNRINVRGALGEIGTRGLVIHRGERKKGEYAYFADNDDESWRSFPVNLDEFAQARGLDSGQIAVLMNAGAPVAAFSPSGRGITAPTIVLNLDAFHDMPAPETGPRSPEKPELRKDVPAFLIREGNSYYAVSEDAFHPLRDEDAGEAKILVRRGAIAAGIPENSIPVGTNCQLINLTQLLPQ